MEVGPSDHLLSPFLPHFRGALEVVPRDHLLSPFLPHFRGVSFWGRGSVDRGLDVVEDRSGGAVAAWLGGGPPEWRDPGLVVAAGPHRGLRLV